MEKAIIERVKDLKVLIIGDVMLDRYLYGSVDRISPEAPVPILNFEKQEEKLGGAGNVAINFRNLDCACHLVSIIGNDKEGTTILDLLETYAINTSHIYTSTFRPTTLKSRLLGNQQHLLRVDRESSLPLNSEESIHFLSILEDITFQNYDIVILQDYNKGVLSENIISYIIQVAKNRSFIAVDPKIANIDHYKGVHLMKPNIHEFRKLIGRQIPIDKEVIHREADILRKNLNIRDIMITLGEYGIMATKGDSFLHTPAQAIEIADVCGAGDAVICIASIGYVLGLSLSEINALSNKAGAHVCQHVGVESIHKDILQP